MLLTTRSRAAVATVALSVLLLLGGGAVSAQVATLVGPDETPEPEVESDVSLEFTDREEAILAYAECMRDNGIDMDDPQAGQAGGRFLRPGGARGIDEFGDDFLTAQEACAPMLEAARPEIDPEAQQELLEEQLAMAQCIRDSGYPEYPDPVVDSDGRFQRMRGQFEDTGIDPRSEEFMQVRSACAEQLELELFGAGPGGGGGFRRGGDG